MYTKSKRGHSSAVEHERGLEMNLSALGSQLLLFLLKVAFG